MNYELEARIRTDLQSGEKLLWTGHPAQGLRLRGTDVFMIPISLVWASFLFYALYQGRSEIRQYGSAVVHLLWIPLALIATYNLLGRFFVDSAIRARTYYAVTSRRAIILTGLFTQELRSYSLRNLREIALKIGPGARGAIEFGSSAGPMSWQLDWLGTASNQPSRFELIEEPRHVYELLRSAQHSAGEVGA